MENFAKKLGWPFEGSAVPSHSSVADTTEDVIARVVKKELARFGGGNTGTGNTGGGANQESLAKLLGLWFVRSETAPPTTMFGVPVVWVDASGRVTPIPSPATPIPSPATPTPAPVTPTPVTPAPAPVVKQAHPVPPTFSSAGKSYTVPTVEGVTYQVEGRDVTGTVQVTPPKTITVVAKPKQGYSFPVGTLTSWSFEFEETRSPFDDAVLPITSYLRLDDAAGATVPRDRGTSPLTLISKYGGAFTPGAPGIGIGATAARVTGNGSIVAQFNPSDVHAYTVVSVHKVNRQHTQAITLTSLWSNGMPSLLCLTAKGGGTAATVNFQNAGGAKATTVNPAPALADGDLVVMVQTWDGTTIHGFINGVEVATIPWAGSTSTNDALKLVSWSAPGGEISIAGLGFQKGEAKSAEWVRAAYEAAKRGAAA